MRKKIIFLVSLLLLTTVLCSCQKSPDTKEAKENLTKSEWVGLLGNKFGYNAYENTNDFYSDVKADSDYYNEIQACAEWEVLTEKDTFYPKELATLQYAVQTSVRAIGIEKLNNADIGMEVTEDNLVEFFSNNIAHVDTEVLNQSLSKEEASMILAYAYNYATNLVLPQKIEYTYKESVKEAPAGAVTLKGDGVTAIVRDGASYKTGDIIYVESSEESAAYAIQVNSVSENQITYEQMGIEDVYEEIQVSGTYEATVINVEPAPGVTISDAGSSQGFTYASYKTEALPKTGVTGQGQGVILTGVKKEGNSVKLDADLGDGVSLNIALSDIKVNADVDYGFFKGLKKANATMSFNDSVTAQYKAEHISKQVPLGVIEVVLGPTPLSLRLSLVANLGFDGKVTLTYSSKIVAMVNYQEGRGFATSVSNTDPHFDFHADATITVEPCVKLELCCIGFSLVNVKVASGVVVIANIDVDLLGDQPSCIDIYAYVPFRWAINEDGCLMTFISDQLKVSGNIWDSENSPINKRLHWENGQLVDACTRGKEEIKTEVVDEEGNPYDEYKIFEFEEIVFGFIKVASQKLYLSKGESMPVGILSVPDGYKAEDLVYKAEDSSVCITNGRVVTAVGSGSTTLQISTSDGKYSVYVAVVVEIEYNDTSGFQEL